jgi:hypothetical protein
LKCLRSLNSNWARIEEDKEVRRGMHAWLLEPLTEDLRTEMGGGKNKIKQRGGKNV